MPGGGTGAVGVTPLRAQRLLELLAFSLMPAVAAGAITADHLGGLSHGALFFGCVLLVSRGLERRLPLHLMPLASALVRGLVPALGTLLAVAVLAAAGGTVPTHAAVAPVLGAWLVMALAAWVKLRFDSARPVRIAIIGPPALAVGLAEELTRAGVRGYTVVGWLADDRPLAEPGEGGPRRLGSLAQVGEVVRRHSVDLLAHSSRPHGDDAEGHTPRLELFERVAADCLKLPVRLIEAGQLYEDLLGHVPIGQSNAAWFQYLLHPRYRPGSAISKRAFDMAVGGAMLVLAAPVLAVCAVAIKLTDGGPILYRQRRVGEGGREIEMIKLRSMRIDSEEGGPRWAEAEDERVTPIGRLMRRCHLDEMPQLWNILRGDMTLVGPRPERPELIAELEQQLAWYDRRHLVKPGLAGWAQARCGYGGSEEETGWKLCHDLFYLKHRSLYFDALVLAENVRISLGGDVQFGVPVPQEEFIRAEVGEHAG